MSKLQSLALLRKKSASNILEYLCLSVCVPASLFCLPVYLSLFAYLLLYLLFHLHVPLRVGSSPIFCITGLMAFLHFKLSLAKLRFKHFLHRSVLTTTFYLNFGLPQEVVPPSTKFLLIFFHDVSSCQCK